MPVLKETTSYRTSLKERILETAMRAFAEHGVRAVKMDDIATELTISKRTLYEIFEDKEQLLYEGIKRYDEAKRHALRQYAAEGHRVIDIILEAYRMKVKEVRMVNPLFYVDILKYPRVAQFIRENNEKMRHSSLEFMQRGVEEGFLRPDVNYEMVPYMFDAIGQYVLNNDLLQRYSFEELFSNYFLVSLRGLCTAEGIRMVDAAVL